MIELVIMAVSLALQVLCGWYLYQAGRRRERLERAQAEAPAAEEPVTDNVAQALLADLRSVDAVAIVTCSIVGSTVETNGIHAEELHLIPSYATRSKRPEPCLLEVAKGMRILADRMDEAVAASGYERAGDSIWSELTPPNKSSLN